ncbi:TRAP transporter small permease [Desulfocurvus sp. DL9XJH121]
MHTLERLADILDTAVRRMSAALLVLGGTALTLMAVLACANMLMRGAFEAPIRGTYELMGFAGALVCAFALAPTQLHKGHIALTMLAGKLPRGLEKALDVISNAACAAFFILVAWKTSQYASSLIEFGELSEDLHLPFAPFVFAVALGCLVLGLALIADLLRVFAPGGRK